MQYVVRQSQPKPKSRRKWLILAIIIAAIAVVVGIFIFWARSSDTGKINQAETAPQSAPVTYKTYNGKYVTLQYKSIYQQKTKSTEGTNFEQSLLRANTSYEKTLAIEVQPIPLGGTTADSGYLYRQQHPELYQSQQVTVAGATATKWVKTDGTEQTIYIPHGNQYAVISFNLDRTNDTAGLADEVTALLQSFIWK